MKRKLPWAETVRAALDEDIGAGDLTARLVPRETVVRGSVIAGQPGVLAGLEPARTAFALVDDAVDFQPVRRDGDRFGRNETVLRLSGPARSLLTAERTALNFLGRLSGIATLTRHFADAAEGTGTAILDTRKTTPTLRALEKQAVRLGGGVNHRFGLFDGVLVKDNHITALLLSGEADGRAGAVALLLARARNLRNAPGTPAVSIEVEAENEAEALEAAGGGADIIMLDNMSPEKAARACRRLREAGFRGAIEISGGVTPASAAAYARAGADRISIGALTHSAPALDFSLEFERG